MAAADYARSGTVITIGVHAEFQYSFRAIDKGDALSTIVLDFYQSFPYVAMMMKPGTEFARPVRLPFQEFRRSRSSYFKIAIRIAAIIAAQMATAILDVALVIGVKSIALTMAS